MNKIKIIQGKSLIFINKKINESNLIKLILKNNNKKIKQNKKNNK